MLLVRTRTHALTNSPAQNEKRKDKDLTEKITRILKTRDEVLKVADIRRSAPGALGGE